MVVGLLATGLFCVLPLALTGPLAFIVLRACAGLSTALYDPAARGYLTDATPPERRGEAFGLYGAVQMGGLLLGPAIGALRRPLVRWHRASCSSSAGSPPGWPPSRSPCAAKETSVRTHPAPAPDSTQFPPEAPSTTRRAAADVTADRDPDPALRADRDAPDRLWNRGLIAALVINAGGYFAGGTYEVIWSLFLTGLGAERRPRRPDLRDVRAAGAAPVALCRAARRPARLASRSSSSARSCRR